VTEKAYVIYLDGPTGPVFTGVYLDKEKADIAYAHVASLPGLVMKAAPLK
jgi:hypothetical protein